MISIIIPTLNAEQTLKVTINSIQQQLYTDFEVLVIDGGSTDGTIEIINEITAIDQRFQLISEPDSGIYDAMNKGVNRSKGAWIYFLGSDDYLYSSNVLQVVIETIACYPEIEIVYGNVRLSSPFKNAPAKSIYDGEFNSRKLLSQNICHQAMFFHRSVFERFGNFQDKYKYGGDYDFNLRCFNKVTTQYIDLIIAFYSTNGRSSQDTNGDNFFYEQFLYNMAVNYSYSYKDQFFRNRKRELFLIFKQQTKSFCLKPAFRIGRILCHHALQRKMSRHEYKSYNQ